MNYFRYTPATSEAALWGVSVTASGFTRIPPRSEYPPLGHPADHHFQWQEGRVLATFQVVFILEGSGTFESRSHGSCVVPEGAVFLLFPKEWHRFAPDPRTGWVESWFEVDGDVVRRLLRSRVFDPGSPLQVVRQPARLQLLFEQIHGRLRDGATAFDPEVSAAALGILAQLHAEQRATAGAPSSTDQVIMRAQALMAAAEDGSISMPQLARKLGAGYSHFRREFKRRVGVSPKRYRDRIRLERGRRLLGGTSLTLDEIAGQLGYLSGFHFSTAFKREFGLAPALWRRTHARK